MKDMCTDTVANKYTDMYVIQPWMYEEIQFRQIRTGTYGKFDKLQHPIVFSAIEHVFELTVVQQPPSLPCLRYLSISSNCQQHNLAI